MSSQNWQFLTPLVVFLLSKVYVVNRLWDYLPPPYRDDLVYGRPLTHLIWKRSETYFETRGHILIFKKMGEYFQIDKIRIIDGTRKGFTDLIQNKKC